MKQLTFITLLLLFGLVQSYATNPPSINLSGESNTTMGNYTIKELPPVEISGELMRTFELTYENAKKPVLIYLDTRANCKDYIVRSKNLEVKYSCKKSSFGVQHLSARQMKYAPDINELFLSQDEFSKQQKIAEGGIPVISALGLIASYYPSLLKSPDLLN